MRPHSWRNSRGGELWGFYELDSLDLCVRSDRFHRGSRNQKGAASWEIRAALASSPIGAVLNGPLGGTFGLLLEWLNEWLANRGIILLNIGAFKINGHFDQGAFDRAMDEGLAKIESGETLSPEEMREIDERVKEIVRRFIPYNP